MKPCMRRTAGLLIAFAAPVGLAQAADKPVDLAQGAYLLKSGGCVDCHVPWKLGPNGPAPDLARGLMGHPQKLALPPPPAAQGPWVWGGAATNTAFWGPWGISYSANLTPDVETGIGAWSADQFIAAMRRGQHLGVGRPILPPMPWQALGQMSDADLRNLFAYLKAQPAVKNAVPAPQPPSSSQALRP